MFAARFAAPVPVRSPDHGREADQEGVFFEKEYKLMGMAVE